MRKKFPAPIDNRHREIAVIAFGLGILLAFFLSSRALALIEAILIVTLGVLLLTDR